MLQKQQALNIHTEGSYWLNRPKTLDIEFIWTRFIHIHPSNRVSWCKTVPEIQSYLSTIVVVKPTF